MIQIRRREADPLRRTIGPFRLFPFPDQSPSLAVTRMSIYRGGRASPARGRLREDSSAGPRGETTHLYECHQDEIDFVGLVDVQFDLSSHDGRRSWTSVVTFEVIPNVNPDEPAIYFDIAAAVDVRGEIDRIFRDELEQFAAVYGLRRRDGESDSELRSRVNSHSMRGGR